MSGRRFVPRRSGLVKRRVNLSPHLESLETRQLLAVFTVTTTGDNGSNVNPTPGSLREAILNSNVQSGRDTIEFRIAGSGVKTIVPPSPLPAIDDAATIDGTTQPGFSAAPLIQIDGSLLTGNAAGLRLIASTSNVFSLAINSFPGDGINVLGSSSTIQGCFIGVDANGSTAKGNNASGINLASGSSGNSIGGDLSLQANVISANKLNGIRLINANNSNSIIGNFIGTDFTGAAALPNTFDGIFVLNGSFNSIGGQPSGAAADTSGANVISGNGFNGITFQASSANTVIGNFIGTSLDGTAAIPNGGNGISFIGAPGNFVGGTLPGDRNIISGNRGSGITTLSSSSTDRNAILGNYIGTDVTGNLNLGNKGAGIAINGGTSDSIGGTAIGAGNIIAFNGDTTNAAPDDGIFIFSGTSIAISSNSIFSNAGLGINLDSISDNASGVTPNDPRDLDTGPNNLQNYPLLSLAATGQSQGGQGSNQTIVRGTLNSAPSTTYRIEFFASDTADPSGFGEGKTFLGSTTVTTDTTGNAAIKVTLPKGTTIGQVVTATAMDPAGNTSEFSGAKTVSQANIADLELIGTDAPDPVTVNGSLVYTLKVTNNGAGIANNVVLTDTLPPDIATTINVTTDHGTAVTANGVVNVQIGNLAKGEVATITIAVTPLVAELIENKASVSSDDIDPDLSNNAVDQTTSVNIPADVTLSETIDPSDATVNGVLDGQSFIYVLSINNDGPGPASGVVLTQNLPANVTLDGISSSQGTATNFGNTVLVNLGAMIKGALATVRITVHANGTGIATDTVSVTSNELDLNPANNSSSVSLVVHPAADLAIEVSGLASPEIPGQDSLGTLLDSQQLTYTITVTNNGPDNATGVTIKDILPPDVTFITADDGVVPVNNTLTFLIGNLAVGDSVTKTVTISDVGGSGNITNIVTTHANEPDSSPSDNSANIVTTVNPADLGVTTFTTPSLAKVGIPLTYHVVVTNNGPATSHGVVLTDLVPSGVGLIGTPATDHGSIVTNDGQTIVASLGDLAPGESATLTFVVTSSESKILVNTATVASDNGSDSDLDLSNNTFTLNVPVSPANLTVGVAPSKNSVLVGDSISYKVTVTNHGPTAATGVTLIDALPANAEFVSAVPANGSTNIGRIAGNLVAAIGNLASGQSYVLTITFKALTEGTIVNKFSVSANELDLDLSNNNLTTATPVTNALGVVNFSQAVYLSGDNAGMALITVQRTGGTKGTFSVGFSTTPGTAIEGTNYRPVSGIFTFGPGETIKTFQVPILDDGEVTGDKTVNLVLTDTGGSPIGAQPTAVLNIIETDVDLIGPNVLDIQLQGTNRSVTGATLTFSEALDKASAENINNYTLIAPPIRTRHGLQHPTVIGAIYNPSNFTVVLSFSHGLKNGVFNQLNVNGNSGGVTDRFGNPVGGGGYNATFARGGNLRYADHNGDLVTLQLSGGGVIDLFRQPNGEAGILRLIGTVPGRSSLNGSVRRRGPTGDGITTLERIDGLGTFGAVRSRLRTPPFVVTNVPLPEPVTVNAVPSVVQAFKNRRLTR